jgi:hypothetical protein
MREPRKIPDFIKMDVAKLLLYPKAAVLVFSRLAQRAGWDFIRIDRITRDAANNVSSLNRYCRP